MTAINHAVFGAVIAAAIPHPYVALPLALVSHFLLDSLPHFGTTSLNEFLKVFFGDGILILVFFTILFVKQPIHWQLLAISAFVAMSPDLMWMPNALRVAKGIPRKKLNGIMKFHKNIQWGERPWGLAIEIPWLIVFSYILVSIER